MMVLSPELVAAETAYRTQRAAEEGRSWFRRAAAGPADTAAPTRSRGRQVLMDTQSAIGRFQAALRQQLVLSGDPAVEAAGEALQAGVEPAVRQLAFDLAEESAAEVAAQLPEHEVDVVLRAGQPVLAVRGVPAAAPAVDPSEDAEARITLRLPPSVKARVEEAATSVGDSVNTWIVRSLSARAVPQPPPPPGVPSAHRFTGKVRT